MNTQTIAINGLRISRRHRASDTLKTPLLSLFRELHFLWQRQRRRLLELEDHLLKDIGISRADPLQEGRKPFWYD